MRKKFYSLLIFLFTGFYAISQEIVTIHLLSISEFKSDIKIEFELANNSDNKVAVYSPSIQDICKSIFKIVFVSIKDSTRHTYEPCTWYTDLSTVRLDCDNSLLLWPKQKKKVTMNLLRRHFSPYLSKKTSYEVSLGLYLIDIDIDSIFENYFKGSITSNCLIFYNK